MDCKHARQAIVLEHYGELGHEEQVKLDEHLRACPVCAADREETRRVLTLVSVHASERVPELDRERSWHKIRAGLREPPRRAWFHLASGWRWGLVAAGAALVLALGIVIGRFGVKPAPEPDLAGTKALPVQPSPDASSIRPVLTTHLEDLQPVLLDFANSVNGGKPGAPVVVDAQFLRGVMLENLLLRRALSAKDPAAAELLDDLDLVLREIINGKESGGASPAQIRELIRERDILFRMRVIKRT